MTYHVTKPQLAGAHPGDADLLEQALEAAAMKTGDLTPSVYAHFFRKRPDAVPLFQTNEMARGHMLTEVIFLLLDEAADKDYVDVIVTSTANDHTAYGVVDPSLYTDFFEALRDAIVELIGDAWTAEMSAAWQRQCRKVMSRLPKAEAFAKQARAARQAGV